MSQKPIFVATHPRACSTAFERVRQASSIWIEPHLPLISSLTQKQVFMTCRDRLQCIHEPFGDAYYFGPERLGTRYDNDERARKESGFSNSTFKTIFDQIDQEASEVSLSLYPQEHSIFHFSLRGPWLSCLNCGPVACYCGMSLFPNPCPTTTSQSSPAISHNGRSRPFRKRRNDGSMVNWVI